MLRAFLPTVLAAALAAAPVKQTVHSAKKPVTHSTTKASSAAVSRSRSGARRRLKNGRYVRLAPQPSYQLHPDPERYRQIQQALADRGYYQGQVNGVWGEDSIDALKRFQTDGKLEGEGKIDALTLTGLGLGPKHDGSTASTVPLSAATPVPGAPSELPREVNNPE